jgi:hypothetical protein
VGEDGGLIAGHARDPVSQTGDLWLLGRHRLLCGDSTVATDVERDETKRAPSIWLLSSQASQFATTRSYPDASARVLVDLALQALEDAPR